MAGCFGNSAYDRYLERETDRYCDEMYSDDEDDEKQEKFLDHKSDAAEFAFEQQRDMEDEINSKEWGGIDERN